jgi:hypothetical protein
MKRGASVGLIVLLVALVVVMLLVARSWRSVAPEAIQVSAPNGPDVNVKYSDHGESAAGASIGNGRLPDLPETRQRTDAHAEQVQSALDATNQ